MCTNHNIASQSNMNKTPTTRYRRGLMKPGNPLGRLGQRERIQTRLKPGTTQQPQIRRHRAGKSTKRSPATRRREPQTPKPCPTFHCPRFPLLKLPLSPPHKLQPVPRCMMSRDKRKIEKKKKKIENNVAARFPARKPGVSAGQMKGTRGWPELSRGLFRSSQPASRSSPIPVEAKGGKCKVRKRVAQTR